MSRHTVAVFGAAGHTGAFVSQELERRGCDVIRIRRTKGVEREERTGWRYANCEDAEALDRALEGASALINCAGPFWDTAFALVESALRCGVHYFDVSAEQRAARLLLAGYADDAARSGLVVMPAVAFYGGLADLLASSLWNGSCTVDKIQVGVALDSWQPTYGTRVTGIRNTARRIVVKDGAFSPLPNPPPAGRWTFAPPFGS